MIFNVTTVLESILKQLGTPLDENENQQQIYRWVIKYLLQPLVRGDYTDWEFCKSIEEIILLKSSCTTINTSIKRYLNTIFPSLKCCLLKYLRYLLSLGEINYKNVRNTIT